MPVLEPLENGDQWPFSWSTVNVPGSPGLSRLFAALELEESSPVPEFFLSDIEVKTSQTVSVTELSDLFNGRNKVLVYDVVETGKFQRHNAHYDYGKPPHGRIPWKDLDRTFLEWSESPLTKEVYVFPASVVSHSSSLSFPRQGTMASLENQETDLLGRLHKLEASLLPKHPGVIATKEALADVYMAQGKLQESLKIFHQVYQQRSRIWGSTHVSSLRTRLRIAGVFLSQELYKTGLNFVEDIISEIKDNVGPEHEITISAAVMKAYFLSNLGGYEEAERTYRRSLQIRLNNYGPKDRKTLELMRMLGVLLAKGNHARTSSGEKLLRTTVQIYNESFDSSEAALCKATVDLGWTLAKLKLYEDSYQVRQAALLRFEPSLGPQHPAVLRIKLGLGWNLSYQGKFEESERVFRHLLEMKPQPMRQRKLNRILAVMGLAYALWKLSHFEESISCSERVFRGFTEIFGPEHRGSCSACEGLGRCYEQQNRTEDAVELYRRTIKMLQEGGFPDHPAIIEYTVSIERLTAASDSAFQ
jgi:tetratricopeptide (TPR) repeat protein